MSYILDALRRAESERERGHLPTLHTQAAAAASPDTPSRTLSALHLGVTVAALAALALAVYLWPSARQATAPATAPIAPTPAAKPATAMDTTKGTAIGTAIGTPAGPGPLATAQPVTLPAAPPAPLPATPTREPSQSPPKPQAPPPNKASLPEDLKRELPPLVSGGAMYSDTPSARMLILDGQVLHEGATVAPNLVLEQIQLRSAVLVFKGQRFSIQF